MYYINMNTNSSNSSLLNRAVDGLRRRDRWRSRGALLFRPRIVLGAGISDAPPRSWAHADRPAHLGSDSRPAADFRYRGVDKLMTEVETRDIPRNWDVFVTAGMCITKPPQSFHPLHVVQQRYAFLLI